MSVNKESKKPLTPTPEEDAAINAGIEQDPDNPEWTEADFKRARPAKDVVPGFVKAAQEGNTKIAAKQKVRTTIRLDQEIVEHFKSIGEDEKGWQTRINQVLSEHVGPGDPVSIIEPFGLPTSFGPHAPPADDELPNMSQDLLNKMVKQALETAFRDGVAVVRPGRHDVILQGPPKSGGHVTRSAATGRIVRNPARSK